MKIKRIVVYWISSVLLLISVAACSGGQPKYNFETPKISQADKPIIYIIQPGDQLDIKFFYNPELNESVQVRPDGNISLQLVEEIRAAGLTPFQLDDLLTQRYAHELKNPVVTVIVRSFSGQRVYVGGEVNRQGLINLPPGMTALQAVFQARGFRETAEPKETIVIRKGQQKRPVPIRVDLAAALYGNGNGVNFRLQPEDVIYVPKSAIAKANKFVNQYIEQLIMFRGIGLSFDYNIVEASND
jgi:protein involved in polysaccharide export with SLBB domain